MWEDLRTGETNLDSISVRAVGGGAVINGGLCGKRPDRVRDVSAKDLLFWDVIKIAIPLLSFPEKVKEVSAITFFKGKLMGLRNLEEIANFSRLSKHVLPMRTTDIACFGPKSLDIF